MNLKRKPKENSSSALNRKTKGEKVVYSIFFAIFFLYALALLYPIYYLIINSLQDGWLYNELQTVGINPFSVPWPMHFENYLEAFKMSATSADGSEVGMIMMYVNSIWICGLNVGLSVFMCCVTGYVMSKYTFKARGFIYAVIIFTMTIPVVGTTGSMFKLVNDLNIYNTPFHVMLTHLGGLGFNFLVMYGFFSNVSWSYAEAVFLDGGGHFTAFFKVILPQAKACILTLCIVAFISAWNDYMGNLLFLPSFPTVSSGLYLITRDAARDNQVPLSFAALIVSVVPVVVVFACFSDTIMKNFSVGGLKG